MLYLRFDRLASEMLVLVELGTGCDSSRMGTAVFWMRSHDALMPAIASSPPPAQLLPTRPKQ